MDQLIKKLYDEKLKYNCYCDSISTQKNGVLYIVYLGSYDFIIINNYYGCIASGKRTFNYDNNTLNINYNLLNDNILNSYIIRLIKKHENNFRLSKDIIINISKN